MYDRCLFAIVLLFSSVTYSAPTLVSAQAEPAISDLTRINPWAQIAKTDLTYIYQTVKDNHPGAIDDQNPYFSHWLEQGYREGLARAEKATSLQDVTNSLSYFVAGFADGHFSIMFNQHANKLSWTGIGIEKQLQDYKVYYTAKQWKGSLPAVGAKLISCDNISVDTMMDEHILKYRFNSSQLNSRKVSYAKKLLIDDKVGEFNRPSHCVFEFNSEKNTFALNWQQIDTSELYDALTPVVLSSQFSIHQFKPNHYWVRLPNFYPSGDDEIKLQTMIAKLTTLRNASLVVFDVRGNGGGSSQWGQDLLSSLYGEDYIAQVMQEHPDNSYALWRASVQNHAYLVSLKPMLIRQFGADSDLTTSFLQTTVDMQQAIEKQQPLVKEASPDNNLKNHLIPQATSVAGIQKSLYQGKTILLTDKSCGSACLDFADVSLSVPKLIHAGQETSADTVYMDVRGLNLPSNLGAFSLAQKVYRDRERGHNQSYVPQYQFNGSMTDTKGLQTWVLSLLK
ncbi:S41 family peptidase [Shewanella glacialimarina]|uniref:S41 family peptidase n=1 Tax=Shewanella glacialimarina TaxID=2590884 RepID=UPI001CF8A236|nr:S41 family peptidase [Shewanella glacialimarina]UCX03644.1 hypothetical protein FJ709_03370 [Shewanella glacialimarina]